MDQSATVTEGVCRYVCLYKYINLLLLLIYYKYINIKYIKINKIIKLIYKFLILDLEMHY